MSGYLKAPFTMGYLRLKLTIVRETWRNLWSLLDLAVRNVYPRLCLQKNSDIFRNLGPNSHNVAAATIHVYKPTTQLENDMK